ncbi:MAG: hypothetical protein HKN18_01720 [Silicimonas sp.]|nr:hypothetical protein [Silicimonas sp.]NNF71069.1 hypothetical protein [Paracoccaceae bacterium]
MFPLSDLGVLALTASAPFLAGALTGVLRRRWSVLVLLLAAVVFYGVYVRPALDSTDAAFRGLAASVYGAIFLLAWVLGELWGWGIRVFRQRVSLPASAAWVICILPALAVSGWTLHRQYVPESCLGGLTVQMGGAAFHLGVEDNAWLAWYPDGAGEAWEFYSAERDRKDSLARLCRLGSNGDRPLTAREVALGEVGTRATSCQEGRACITTDTSEFLLQSVALEDPVKPSAWFGDEIRDDIQWSGTAGDGWICFLPNGSFTWVACQRWITPASGVRAMASADFEAGTDPERAVTELETVIADWLVRLTEKP